MKKEVVTCDICGKERTTDAGARYGGWIKFCHTEIHENRFGNRQFTVDFCEGCYASGKLGAYLDQRLSNPGPAETSSLGSAGHRYGSKA